MEVWKPVKGFEGFYEISNTGRVKSLERISRRNNKPYKKKEKILTPIPMGNYLGIQLAINKKHKKRYIHRLVADAFVEPKSDIVNHKDGNKHNNNANNLEWVTNSENISHAYDNKLNNNYGENSHYCKYPDAIVSEMRRLYKTGEYSQADMARKFNMSKMQAHRILTNKLRKRKTNREAVK